MNLGNFSVSLAVKDIKASKEFYEKLGFEKLDGDEEQNWLIMKNGDAKIGLFQGMFDKNILTFNPDGGIQEIQKDVKSKGIELKTETDEEKTGPGHIAFEDPDGNQILIDSFV